MNKDWIERHIAWFKAHPELQQKPSMKRRSDDYDYTARCIYLFTIAVHGRQPLLGTLRPANHDHPAPWVQPSPIGEKVLEKWAAISFEQPLIKSIAFQLMPDHVHDILFVTAPIKRHVGHVISRFKARSTAETRSL